METKITDLLDCIQDDSVHLNIRSVASVRRIQEVTMKKINDRSNTGVKKKVRKLSSIVAIAAVIILLLSAATYATNAFGVAEYFNSFFGDLDDNQTGIVESIGTTEFYSVTSNGTTITPLAAISDERFYYISLRIEAPEDVEFKELTEDEGYYQFGVDVRGTAQYKWYPGKYADKNMIEVAVVISSDFSKAAKADGTSPDVLKLENIYIQSPDKVYTTLVEGIWDIDISQDFAVAELNIPVEGIEISMIHDLSGDEYVMSMQHISLSNISISFSYTYLSDNDWVSPGLGHIVVVMQDGSEIDTVITSELFDGFTGSIFDDDFVVEEWVNTMWLEGYEKAKTGIYREYEVNESLCFAAPIDLDEVAYIQFGTERFFVER